MIERRNCSQVKQFLHFKNFNIDMNINLLRQKFPKYIFDSLFDVFILIKDAVMCRNFRIITHQIFPLT